MLPAGLMLLAVDLGPMLYALQASFTHWIPVEPGSENDPAGIAHYLDILSGGEFWSAVRVTIIYAVCSIACGLVLGTAIALALDLDLDFHARGLIRAPMMIPMVITPSVVGYFGSFFMSRRTGSSTRRCTGSDCRAFPRSDGLPVLPLPSLLRAV